MSRILKILQRYDCCATEYANPIQLLTRNPILYVYLSQDVSLLHVKPTDGYASTLALFCTTYSHLLLVLDDEEVRSFVDFSGFEFDCVIGTDIL